MNAHTVARPEPPDALFDTRPAALAARFGARAITLIRQGREPHTIARLAFTYAALALRDQAAAERSAS